MKRRLFNLLAAASLVLCVPIVILWITSIGRTAWSVRDDQANRL